jgi:hypothetical protein
VRWHLHDLDPELAVPLGALDRGVWLDRLGRRLARLEQQAQVRIASELVIRCRGLTRAILELDRELEQRAAVIAPRLLALPGCGAISAMMCSGASSTWSTTSGKSSTPFRVTVRRALSEGPSIRMSFQQPRTRNRDSGSSLVRGLRG